MVSASDTFLLFEDLFPFVSALFVNAVKNLI